VIVLLCVALAGGLAVRRAALRFKPDRPFDLDVLFLGAHPDDEAFNSQNRTWFEDRGGCS